MATVTFAGAVSAQEVEGETVTLDVTKPDTTIDTFTTVTLADKSFTTTRDYLPGDYTVQVSIVADNLYKVATSTTVPFTVGLMDRTITVNVTIA